MRRIHVLAVLAAAVLCFTSDAWAQGMGQGGMGGQGGWGGRGMAGGGGRGAAMIPDPASLPALKSSLAITPAQEPQWKAYADAVSSAWDARQGMRDSMVGQRMTLEERQEVRQTHMAAMAQMQADVALTRQGLYSVLTPDQRRIWNQQQWGGRGRGMGMGPPR